MFLFTRRGSKSKGKSPRARFEDSPLSCNICTNQTRDYLTLHKSLSSGGQQISKIPIHLQCLVTDKGREFVMLSIGLKDMPENLSLDERTLYMQAVGKSVERITEMNK